MSSTNDIMTFSKKFLFIDDDADDRDFFCTTMQMIDPSAECLFAKDGIDAIEQLENDRSIIPHYIFIDMNMPRMDGVECLTKIRQMPQLNDSEIYIYSTLVNPKIKDEVMALGASDILIKPSTIKDLTSLLQQFIN